MRTSRTSRERKDVGVVRVVSFTDRLVLCYGNRLCAECVYSLAASTYTVLSAVQRLGGFIPLGESPNILPTTSSLASHDPHRVAGYFIYGLSTCAHAYFAIYVPSVTFHALFWF